MGVECKFSVLFHVILLLAVSNSILASDLCVFTDNKPEANNFVEVYTFESEGERHYPCYSNGTAYPVSTVGSSGKVIGIPPFQISGHYNYSLEDGIARIYLTEEKDGEVYSLQLTMSEDYKEFPSPDGHLSWRRRNVTTATRDDGLPLADAPDYVLLTGTIGGGPPEMCPEGATNVTVPYIGIYNMQKCVAAAPPTPPSPSSSGFQSSLFFAVVLTICLNMKLRNYP